MAAVLSPAQSRRPRPAARPRSARLPRHQRRHRHPDHEAGRPRARPGAHRAERPPDPLREHPRQAGLSPVRHPGQEPRLAGARARRAARRVPEDARLPPAPPTARLRPREVRRRYGGEAPRQRRRLERLPVPIHSEAESVPYVTAMNLVKDPETGFYNTSHAGTIVTGPRTGLPSFVTPHTHVIMRKYRDLGQKRMPFAIAFGLHPAYEIMANFSGLHMDMWGELEMVGTIMDRDVEMVPCETLNMKRAGARRDRRRGLGRPRQPPRRRRVGRTLELLPAEDLEAPRVLGRRDHDARRPADLPQPPHLPGDRPPAAAAALPRGGALQPADRNGPQGQGRALPDLGRGGVLPFCSSTIRARGS